MPTNVLPSVADAMRIAKDKKIREIHNRQKIASALVSSNPEEKEAVMRHQLIEALTYPRLLVQELIDEL